MGTDNMKMIFSAYGGRAALLCSAGLAALALSTPAYAQDASSTPTCADGSTDANCDPEIQIADDQPTADSDSGVIMVTGSRIRRSEFNSPDPIQIIDPVIEEKKGATSLAEILQSSPLASGSTQITSALSSNFVTDGGSGTETINLRGLGAARTLSLLNGRRAGPAGTRGAVNSFDLNVLPTSAIQSIEILKTGASSIYGSDAIAGVVNLITKTKTDGIELTGLASVPENGGAETYSVSAAWGKEFDRGHILVSADYYRRNELALKQRDFFACQEDYLFREDGTTRADIIDPRTGSYRCSGVLGPIIRVYNYSQFVTGTSNFPVDDFGRRRTVVDIQAGNFGQYLAPFAAPSNFSEFGSPSEFYPVAYSAATQGVYNLQPPLANNDSVYPSVDRFTVYADGAYEFSPAFEVYFEGLYNQRKNYTNGSRQIFFGQYTSDTILAQAFGDCASCSGDPINTGFTGDQILLPVVVTDHFDQQTKVDYYRGVLGARGDLGFNNWRYDLYGQYSRSDGDYTFDIIYQDAVDAAEYRTQSCVGTVTSIRGVPCIDINYTDPRVLNNQFTPEEQAFLFGTDTGNTRYDQKTVELSLSGDLFKLPYGTVQMALGGQYRRDEINDVPGPATQAGNSWGLTSAGVTAGYTRTLEAYGEVEVPLLRDIPFFRDLSLSAAGRVTNVRSVRASDGASASSKGNWTYKIGGNWSITDWLRFRGSYGTSYRSPALFELFLSDQTSFAGQLNIDPCTNLDTRLADGAVSQRVYDNCIASGVPGTYTGGGGSSALIVSGGGIGFLQPETSTAKNLSLILTPEGGLWKGFRASLAVDYFDIKVKGEISQLGASSIIFGCYNSEFYPNEPLCANFNRILDPNSQRQYQIDVVYDSYLNINQQVNKGFDVTARLIQETDNLGTLSILGQMTWQSVDRYALFEGTPQDFNGEVGEPIWTGNFTATWVKGTTSLLYGLNVVGGTDNTQRVIDTYGDVCVNSTIRGGLICPVVRIKPTFYHSASLTQEINDDFQITIGVSNIFDTKPPRVSTVASGIGTFGQAPVASQYDYFGRRFFISLKAKM
jgi:iron complex outermembrane receptor protein